MNPLLPIEQLTVLFLGLGALAAWGAWRSTARCGGWFRVGLLALRLSAFAGLYLLALNFGRWQAPASRDPGQWAVLVDSSASMAQRDAKGLSRWQQALALAGQVESLTDAKFYHFDAELHPVDNPRQLQSLVSDGRQTDLVGALTRLAERFRASGRRLAGVLLLSDGRAIPVRPTETVAMELRSTRSPVYPLVLGETVKTLDLSISPRRLHYVAFPGQPLAVTALLRVAGVENIQPQVSLCDAAGKVLATQRVAVTQPGEYRVPFKIAAPSAGYSTCELRVEPWPGESATANNASAFGLCVMEAKTRILFVEGQPHWDSKFLAQLLQRQEHIELSFIYRLTPERFLSQIDTNRSATALAELPATAEAFSQYDLVIAGKGFDYFLNRDHMPALRAYLRERGGGLLFARGKSYSGEQPDLAALEPIEWGPEWSQTFHWQPTLSGEQSGLFGEGLPVASDPVWAKLPALNHALQALRPKVFAQVLAEGVAETGGRALRFPAVASQRLGKGQVVAVNSDELWQWDFFPKYEGASQVYRDFWLRLVHWALAYAEFLPGHEWSLHLGEAQVEVGQPVRVRVASRQTHSAGLPAITCWRGQESMGQIQLAAVAGQPGEFEGVLTPAQPGLYRLEAHVEGLPQPQAFETLGVRPLPSEESNPNPDRDSLQALAAATEGRLIAASDLPALVKPTAMTEESATLENARWVSTWDKGGWLVLIATLFIAEWVCRRRLGLT